MYRNSAVLVSLTSTNVSIIQDSRRSVVNNSIGYMDWNLTTEYRKEKSYDDA